MFYPKIEDWGVGTYFSKYFRFPSTSHLIMKEKGRIAYILLYNEN